MSAYLLTVGVVDGAPEKKTPKGSRAVVTAKIRVRDSHSIQFFNITAFEERVADELARLSNGDVIAVQGRFTPNAFQHVGATKISFGIVAEQVLVLRGAATELAQID